MKTLGESLNELKSLGLLTQAQHDQLMRVPEVDKVLAGMSSGEILGWMAAQNILEEDALLELWDVNPEHLSDEQLKIREDTIDIAWEKMDDIQLELNVLQLAVLRDELILSAVQFERIKEELPGDDVIATPVEALVEILVSGLLTEAEWQAILAEMEKDRQFASAHIRVDILTEARQRLEEHHIKEKELAKQAFWDSLKPGAGSWFLIFIVAVIAGSLYIALKPKPVPMCDAVNIVNTVNNMLMQTQWSVESRSVNSLLNRSKDLPRLREPQQEGYMLEERVRGCVGFVEWNERKLPYGYTIKPDPQKSEKFEVAGANAEIIKARFGSIDEQGRSTNLAAPIGRNELQAAIRSGVESMPPNESQNRFVHQLNLMVGSTRRQAMDISKQESEVIEIEPLGNCQSIEQTKSQNCEILLLINDRLLEALGRSSVKTIKANFTLVPKEGGSGWVVTEDFKLAYAKLLSNGRRASLSGAREEK